jgi:hypothetical protein
MKQEELITNYVDEQDDKEILETRSFYFLRDELIKVLGIRRWVDYLTTDKESFRIRSIDEEFRKSTTKSRAL